MSKPDMKAIRERCDAATEGPWYLDGTSPKDEPGGFCHRALIAKTSRTQSVYAEPEGGAFPENDRKFIAHARQDIPTLLDEIERLQPLEKENKGLRGLLEGTCKLARIIEMLEDMCPEKVQVARGAADLIEEYQLQALTTKEDNHKG